MTCPYLVNEPSWLTSRARGIRWAVGLFFLTSTGCGAQGPPATEVAHQIERLKVDPSIAGEPLAERASIERFYRAREGRPAWIGRADDVVKTIQGMAADGLDPASYHLEAIQSHLQQPTGQRTAESDAALDVLLADAVARMADDVRYGRVRPAQVNPAWNVDPRENAPPLDSTLAAIAASGSVQRAIDAQRPRHFIYRGLVAELERLRRIESQGGWPSVPAGRSIAPDARDRRVAMVRRRLAIGGDMSNATSGADSTRYDPALVRAVKDFQSHHRLKDTGTIDAGTIAALNVDVGSRIGQVRANLERARWVLSGLGDDFLLVNLPAFKAYLIRGNQNVWEARTQIGQEALQTPTFRAVVRTVVFNPDWTVPWSIVQNEILPQIHSGKDVIRDQGMVLVDDANHEVDATSVNWRDADSTNFRYTLKQPPGPKNPLGRVKFLLPNKYSIYLHDTPSQQLFESSKPTFSHGCIRVENAPDLADRLLEGQDGWSPSKIEDAMLNGQTQNVNLEHPLPILIVYWTVSVGASGEVRYADDIYHLDAPLVAALDRRRS